VTGSSRTTWPTGQSSWTTGFDRYFGSCVLRVTTCSSSYLILRYFCYTRTIFSRILYPIDCQNID
jgi:hypothetical protein